MTESQHLEEFIRNEIAKEKKRQTVTMLLGTILIIASFSYLWFLVARPFEQVVLNPDNLAQAAVNHIDASFEDGLTTLERNIIGNGTMLAERSSHEIESAISIIGEAGVHYIDTLPMELDALEGRSAELIQLYFERHREELREFFKNNGREKFLSHMTEDIFDSIIEDIDTHYSKQDFSFRDVDRMSRLYILEVSQMLTRLSKKSRLTMTQGEAMQRKLIVAWVRMLSSQLKVPLFVGRE